MHRWWNKTLRNLRHGTAILSNPVPRRSDLTARRREKVRHGSAQRHRQPRRGTRTDEPGRQGARHRQHHQRAALRGAVERLRHPCHPHSALGELLPIAAGGLLIVFSAWWIYFVVPIHGHLRSSGRAFLWGYGHYLIFSSAAAIGAGLEVAVEETVGSAHISTAAASAAVTLPTALYLLTVWALHARHFKVGIAQQLGLPVTALLVLCCTFLGGWSVLAAGLVCAAAVATGVTLTARMVRRERAASAGTPAG